MTKMIVTINQIVVIRIHTLSFFFFTCAPGRMAVSGDPRRQVTCLNKAKARRTPFTDSELVTF